MVLRIPVRAAVLITAAALAFTGGLAAPAALATPAPPPAPEPVRIDSLPLPPTAPTADPASCTAAVDPHGTGCMAADRDALDGGDFLPDGIHVLASVRFVDSPSPQVLLIRTDGGVFPDGAPWKCLTCGVPAENAVGTTTERSYPQAFPDGHRALAGSTVIDCGPHLLTDPACTPQTVRLHPIRWTVTPDGSGEGGRIRELRVHPDGVHLGWSSITITGGRLDQFSYLGRLQFVDGPAPRYELVDVTLLFDDSPDRQPVRVDPDRPGELVIDHQARSVGELRGFTSDGREVIYVGYPEESSNIDVFAADLTTGTVRRLTAHPEYTDPVDSSPDDRWIVALDTRGSDRQMFLAAMRGVPPLTDLLTTSAVSSVRNNHQRRFFQPFLIDRAGDRGDYAGQQLNAGDGAPGSATDPNWNAAADPRWSPDGTRVVYAQRQVTEPACGGANPLACPESTEPGGRRSRLMMATLTDRSPIRTDPVAPIADRVPWGTPYRPGDPAPVRPLVPAGDHVLRGQASGTADVRIVHDASGTAISTVAVTYHGFSDDGRTILDGTEEVTRRSPTPTLSELDWFSDLRQSGAVDATKTTGPGGFHLRIDVFETIFDATGTLTTTVDGRTYTQPANGT